MRRSCMFMSLCVMTACSQDRCYDDWPASVREDLKVLAKELPAKVLGVPVPMDLVGSVGKIVGGLGPEGWCQRFSKHVDHRFTALRGALPGVHGEDLYHVLLVVLMRLANGHAYPPEKAITDYKAVLASHRRGAWVRRRIGADPSRDADWPPSLRVSLGDLVARRKKAPGWAREMVTGDSAFAQAFRSWAAQCGLPDILSRARALRAMVDKPTSWKQAVGEATDFARQQYSAMREAFGEELFERRCTADVRLSVVITNAEASNFKVQKKSAFYSDVGDTEHRIKSGQVITLRVDQSATLVIGKSVKFALSWADLPPDFRQRVRSIYDRAGQKAGTLELQLKRVGRVRAK